jgi:hypothetical protein
LTIELGNNGKKKEELEYAFKSTFGKSVALTKLELLQGLLANSFEDASVLFYVELFDEEEVEAMHKRYEGLSKKSNGE